MKKGLSLVLALTLMVSLGLPAAAAGTADARLSAVTQQVKSVLQIDTETYSEFYGELSENELVPTWQLTWDGEDGAIRVYASESGQVLSYYRDDIVEYAGGGDDGLSFPKVSRADAQAAAQQFLNRVLKSGLETAVFEEERGEKQLSTNRYYFWGSIRLNGVDSPLSFSITLQGPDLSVVNFSRDSLEERYIGGVPSATPAVNAAKALDTLIGTQSLRLEYVLSDDGKTAVLQYLPNAADTYYVDAQSGKAVNLTELYQAMGEQGSKENFAGGSPSASANDTGAGRLTEAEQSGIAKLEGVLAKEALDQRAKAISELGLSSYTLASASYSVERPDPASDGAEQEAQVTARLTYARQTEEGVWRRYVSLNAKTGALLEVGSSSPWQEGAKPSVTEAEGQKKAEAFLTKYYGAEFAPMAPYTGGQTAVPYASRMDPRSWSFQYAHQENGVFFPAGNLQVSIDSADGSVSAFRRSTCPNVTYAPTEGIVTADAALTAYRGAHKATLAYQQVPEKLDLAAPQYRALAEMGYSYLFTLKLGYSFQTGGNYDVVGVDAQTGEAITALYASGSGLTYDDLDGNWAKAQIEALAEYGIGFDGGTFQPAKELTQLDLVSLLASTNGYRCDPGAMDQQETDALYRYAYQRGILAKADRSDAKVLTRAETVKLLLDSAGYGNIAGLSGIFQCSYADAGTISQAYYSYAALAQGLNIVNGDTFAPDRTATRAEAAGMLFNLMSR